LPRRLDRTTQLREAMVGAVLASAAGAPRRGGAARYERSAYAKKLAGRGPAGLFREGRAHAPRSHLEQVERNTASQRQEVGVKSGGLAEGPSAPVQHVAHQSSE